jgi:hypothetical protein
MAPVSTHPLPGAMTVPPWFGWENILAVLLVLIVVAVAFVVLGSTGGSGSEKSDWQAYLAARSRTHGEPHDPRAEPVRAQPEPVGSVDGTDRPVLD